MRTVEPEEHFPGLRLQARHRLSGAPSEYEMGILSEICRLRLLVASGAERALDIGAGLGATAEMFAGLGAQVTTIGICDEDIDDLALGLPEHEHIYVPDAETWGFTVERLTDLGVEVIRADTATFNFASLPSFDLMFVDGCHSAEYVRNDSGKAWPRLRVGGLMTWHDYQPMEHSPWPGVRDYLNELAERLPLVHLAGTTLAVLEKAEGMRV